MLAVVDILLVVPTSGNAKVFELALTLFTVEEDAALVLESIGVEEEAASLGVEEEAALVLASLGVEEEDWLDGVVVGKVGGT